MISKPAFSFILIFFFNVFFAISTFKKITIEARIFRDFHGKKRKNIFQKVAERGHWIGSCSLSTKLLRNTESECQIWNQHLRNKEQGKFCYFVVLIRKTILFGPKCPNLGIWAQIFENKCQIWNQHFRNRAFAFVKIRKWIPFGPKRPNLGIWAPNF